MIEVKPIIQHHSNCPHCRADLKPLNLIWQGMHVCVESHCIQCHARIIEDLKVGHATRWNFQVDLEKNLLFKNEGERVWLDDWLGKPLIDSLLNPQEQNLKINKEILHQCKGVIILNCIDFLYGHCLLKLMNAQSHIDKHPNYGLIVIIPTFLRWMVPNAVAEVWTVNIPLKLGQSYYLKFHEFVSSELNRFDEVYVSEAYSHPGEFDITTFTNVPQHDFSSETFRVTFIWREDRIWVNLNPLLFRLLRKLGILQVALPFQNWKIRRLLKIIQSKLPLAKFTVAGLGTRTKFPNWIEDVRVDRFSEETERQACKVYSESRLVIGIHGSNMLLPSGHAGMTIDIMPKDRWSNFAQDILYQEKDPRLAGFRYRYLPIEIGVNLLADLASSMILHYPEFFVSMTAAEKQ